MKGKPRGFLETFLVSFVHWVLLFAFFILIPVFVFGGLGFLLIERLAVNPAVTVMSFLGVSMVFALLAAIFRPRG